MTNRLRLPLFLIAISILLASCGNLSTTTPSKAPASVQDDETRQLLRDAETAPPTQAAELKAQAAERLASQGNDLDAVSILESIDKRRLPPNVGLDVALQQASYLLDQNNAEAALRALDFRLLPPALNSDQIIQLNIARSDAFMLSDKPIRAARELISASQMTDDVARQQALHDQIWSILQGTDPSVLQQATEHRDNNFFDQGWFERAAMLANIDDFNQQQEQLFDWQLLWDQHPAAKLPPRAADAQLATDLQPIPVSDSVQRIALLLPLQGNLAEFSRVITEGFITAMQQAQMSQSEVIMLDSTEIRSPEQLFQAARTQGADFIVGPLDRSFVNRLAEFPEHPVPVLALNPVEQGMNPPLQLDLSSEHEALSLVNRAIQAGYQNAMIIRSDNRAGERFEELIRDAYAQQGGVISASLNFKPTESNSDQIRQLLMQDPEMARTMPSRSRSGMNVDVSHETDVIFMAAEPGDARLIRPMLLYHFAGAIPVMATSQLYEGTPNASRDQDLNGIQFVDVPWRLAEPSETRAAISELRSDADSDIGKLYALGADAFLVSQQLILLLQQNLTISGETGHLAIGNNRRITRSLAWAEFINGVPQLITE